MTEPLSRRRLLGLAAGTGLAAAGLAASGLSLSAGLSLSVGGERVAA